ncbi:alpha 1,2-mannosyltransferase 2.4.1 [Lodderomyces elongisporus]|uniref:alpha 1,2-mannosyltransferase 2.4.1 n=1 Tax=Lodderomyces elongisporus TaxID=36914 RepID=UPI00291CB7D8|nr:alpha 1,2-mannosyltransferase 2.4.1 [Lodderomyces elongisporus]WLF78524.1 alpha 1,2-mannosyltransferase 2.4.1 [Lodderomyces elongisporus]
MNRQPYIKYVAFALTLLLVFTLTHRSNTRTVTIIQQQQSPSDSQSKGELVDQENAKLNSGELGNTKKPVDVVQPGGKVKATFVTLARNSELYKLIKSIREVEDRFNRKYNYDWVFLNDQEFTEEFKELTSAIVSGNTKYGLIPKEHWSYPSWIDQEKARKAREKMHAEKIIYGGSESYRFMCHYESGYFYKSELLDEYDWYWRVEPDIHINCDINYDVFQYMEDHNKVYGFTVSLYEFKNTIPTLWDHTKKFIQENPQYLAKDNFMDFISDDGGETYNLCHFWTNFEVASLKFWRSEAYNKYFDYLDKQGGFFYERWGDAPIHSIAAALFLPRDKIHYFGDVGYRHGVYGQCPLNKDFRYDHKCTCNPEDDFTFRSYSCGKRYYDLMKLDKPKEWANYQ